MPLTPRQREILGLNGSQKASPTELEYDVWIEVYWAYVAFCKEHGILLTGRGITNEARLRNVVRQYANMVEAQYDPFTIAANVVKAVVGNPMTEDRRELPFSDGNRRMAFTYATLILRTYGYRFKTSEKEAKKFKEEVRKMDIADVERFIRNHSIAR